MSYSKLVIEAFVENKCAKMSTRQVRRLEEAAARAQAGQGVDGSSSSDDLPSTMLRPSRVQAMKKQKKKEKLLRQVQGTAEEPLPDSQPTTDAPQQPREVQPPQKEKAPPSVKSEPKQVSSRTETQNSHEEEDEEEDVIVEGPLGTESGKKQQKKNKSLQKQKKRQQDEEDNLILEQMSKVLGSTSSPPGGAGVDGSESTSEAPGASTSLDSLLYCCDPDWLDSKVERIRAFGKRAVEGDTNGAAPSRLMIPSKIVPKFRPCPLASPDSTWPPFHCCGLRVRRLGPEKKGPSSSTRNDPILYAVDPSDDEYKAAQNRFEAVAAQFGGPDHLIQLWGRQPYHLPTLLQLQTTLQIMGETSESQRILDMALYTVGQLLTTGTVKLSALPTQRLLPSERGGNAIVLTTLHRGVHEALRRGCGRTALELCRLLLSLDDADPKQVLLLVDYCAVRGAQFDWLLNLHHEMKDQECPLQSLPSIHFHAALASFLLRNRQQSKSATAGSDGPKKASGKGKEQQSIKNIVPPEELLVEALRLFPSIGVELGEKIGESAYLHSPPWAAFKEFASRSGAEGLTGAQYQDLGHLGELFVHRSSELWKPSAVLSWFKQCVDVVAKDTQLTQFASRDRRVACVSTPLLLKYRNATTESVMGESSHRIPMELLMNQQTQEEFTAEMRREEERQLPQSQAQRLQQMEAAFGPLDASLTVAERLSIYEDRLEESLRRVGEVQSPLWTFLQTLVPWNSVTSLGLRQAMQDRGVEDPVEAERLRQRRADRAEIDRILREDEEEQRREEEEEGEE
jgi:hypothetical protein